MVKKEFYINFSGIYSDIFCDESRSRKLDLTILEGTNCYCCEEASESVRTALGDVPVDALHWIDTGDYHYTSLFFLERIKTPYTLILIDHHPDDQDSAFGDGILSCGNWVSRARKLPNQVEDYFIDRFPSPLTFKHGKAYLSIDKDVLSRSFARTNWDQGTMSLEELKSVLKSVADSYDIIGADVCGGLTESKGAGGEDFKINCDTDAELRELLLNLMSV